MKDILYHDNNIRPEYDTNGKFLNNWNPDRAFSDGEYICVYFRIRTPSYFHPDRPYSDMYCFDSVKDRNAFYGEIKEIFEGIGWTVRDTTNLINGKAHLYVHPKEISGTVMKWQVAHIAESIANKAKLFGLVWVDLYNDVYDITDEEYLAILDGKREQIRKELLEVGRTSNQYFYERDLIDIVSGRVKTPRVGISDVGGYCHDLAEDVVMQELQSLKEEGVMASYQKHGMPQVRTKQGTEVA